MIEDNAALRKSVYALLIVAVCGTMIGRIWTVQSPLGKTPLLSANDRSRWATVRALVDHGTYELDEVIFDDAAQTKRNREWYSIDMVRHRGADGREHYYSSKPPLLATLIAGKYWLVKQCTGITLGEHPFYAARILLITTNVIPLALFFLLLASLVERFGRTDWGRLYAMVCATFGTFLTTFGVTLNNHLPAAISVAVAVWAALAIWRDGERRWPLFAVCGFFAAFAVTNELPALSLFAVLGAALLWRSPSRTLLAFLPAAGIVAAGFFGTNQIAHGTWRPPYSHRHDGPLMTTVSDVSADQLDAGRSARGRCAALSDAGIPLSDQTTIEPRLTAEGWVLWDPAGHQRLALVMDGPVLRVHQWGDWYEYERSYWLPGRKSGVDLGEPSRAVYAMNVLVGHRGIFSLTPIWLLSAAGAGYWLVQRHARMRGFAAAGAGIVPPRTGLLHAPPAWRTATTAASPADSDGCSGSSRCGWSPCCLPPTASPPAEPGACRRRLVAAGQRHQRLLRALNPWSHSWIYQYWVYLRWITP
jgi:hypothetical protein